MPPARRPMAKDKEPAFRRLPRAVREQQILDAAVVVFSRRGYHDASVDEIADLAKISKPMVYAYVGTKEELFVACLHREGARLIGAVAAATGPDLPPDTSLWRGLSAFFGFVAANREGWRVLYRQARGQEPFVGVLAELRALLTEGVKGMLARAYPQRPQDAAAHAVVGAAEAVADWLVEHPEAKPEHVAGDLMTVIWLGAGALMRGDTWPHPSGDPSSSDPPDPAPLRT